MPAALDTFSKQPGELEDFDVSFDEYLLLRDDTIATHTVDVPVGLTKESSVVVGGVVKVWVSGGVDKTTYRVTITITTAGGRVKQAEVDIKVREI